MDKAEVIGKIEAVGVLPVIRADSTDEAREVVKAVLAGGITIVEITMTVPGAVSLIGDLCGEFGDDLLIGAKFIISPALNFDTIDYCNDAGVVVMPGALTPTEVVNAWDAGADLVKVFPAGALGGPSYLKSLKAPLPHIKLIPTGGINLMNAGDFVRAGAFAIGVGADLLDLKAIREGRSDSITENARKYLEIVKEARA
jgi:2-dehydro-3-deoxyphosphogluconate aldolase/(4S)-4-hydroxy-2-oxoglutarate aldolase